VRQKIGDIMYNIILQKKKKKKLKKKKKCFQGKNAFEFNDIDGLKFYINLLLY